MLQLSGLELRAHGEGVRFREHPLYDAPVRFRVAGASFRAASTGDAPVYMHVPGGARDRTGEVFALYCYFDEETARALRHRAPAPRKAYAAEVEGRLLHWTRGIGVEMTGCRLLHLESAPEP